MSDQEPVEVEETNDNDAPVESGADSDSDNNDLDNLEEYEEDPPLFRVQPKLFGRWEYDSCEDDLEDFGDDDGKKKTRANVPSTIVFKEHIAF